MNSTNIADDVLDIDMPFKLVLIEMIPVAKAAVGVHEGNIAKLIDVALLEMLIQSLEGVELLLLENACLLLYTDLTMSLNMYQT
jgi:hypothetical protein